MIGSIILMILLSPWFWAHSAPSPKTLFNLNITSDIRQARDNVVWERGKTNSTFDNIFINWPIELVNNRISIFMENLDIGDYFFAGHPRERVGVVEKQKFFVFQFVLLVIGLTSVEIKKYKNFLIIYSLLAFLLAFIFEWRTFEQTLVFCLPLLILMALGFKKLLTFSKKWIFLFFTFSLFEAGSFVIFYVNGYLK